LMLFLMRGNSEPYYHYIRSTNFCKPHPTF
jgi:hypothetical protein